MADVMKFRVVAYVTVATHATERECRRELKRVVAEALPTERVSTMSGPIGYGPIDQVLDLRTTVSQIE